MTANLLRRLHAQSLLLPGLMYLFFSLVICAVLLWLRVRIDSNDERWLALILVAIVLTNPRRFLYDETTAFLPACFLIWMNLYRPLMWILIPISIAGFFINTGALGVLFLLTSAFILGCTSLWKYRSHPTIFPLL